MKNRSIRKTALAVSRGLNQTLAICGALLLLASITAVAQDNSSQPISQNDVNDALYRSATKTPNPLGCVGFYDNICGAGYNGNTGWKVSDHSPSFEYSPAMQFTASSSGTSTKITVGLTHVNGTDAAVAFLTEDCGGAPCITPDGLPEHRQLCAGQLGNMPKFKSTHTITVSFACRAQIQQGQKYWLLLESVPKSGLAWNFAKTATGPVYDGVLDSWHNLGTHALGALTVQ